MKQCRISIHGQVIETFETGFYDECEIDQIINETVDCPDEVEPLMWYIDGVWLQENEYQIRQPSQQMTTDQLVDLLKWNGIEVYPL